MHMLVGLSTLTRTFALPAAISDATDDDSMCMLICYDTEISATNTCWKMPTAGTLGVVTEFAAVQ